METQTSSFWALMASMGALITTAVSFLSFIRNARKNTREEEDRQTADIDEQITNRLNRFLLDQQNTWVGRRELRIILNGIDANFRRIFRALDNGDEQEVNQLPLRKSKEEASDAE